MVSARVETIPPVVPQQKYVLELDARESDLLLAVLGAFRSGGPTSEIFRALSKLRGKDRSTNYGVTANPYRYQHPGTLYLVRKD